MKPHAARDALAARDLWQAAAAGSTTMKRESTATEATPRARDRAGGLDRPGVPPGLRGRARLLAVAQHGGAGPEGPPGPARPGLGQPRPPYVPLLAAVLSRESSACSRGWASSCASGFTPARTPAGAPRSSSIRSPASSSSPTSTWRPRRPPRTSPTRSLPDLPRPGTVGLVGRPARRVDPGSRHASPGSPVRLRRPARRPQGRGRHRDDGAVLELPVPEAGVHRRRALAGRQASRRPGARLWAGSTPSSTRSSSATGRSAATSKTWSVARATRASTSRPSARSSRRPIPRLH